MDEASCIKPFVPPEGAEGNLINCLKSESAGAEDKFESEDLIFWGCGGEKGS